MKAITRIVVMLLAGQAYAAEPEICAKLNSAIDGSQKQIASYSAGGVGDDSAPRETNRRLGINNELLLMSMNLSLLAQYKCQMPSEPIVSLVSGYFSAALDCGTERMKGNAGSEKCKREKWSK